MQSSHEDVSAPGLSLGRDVCMVMSSSEAGAATTHPAVEGDEVAR